MLTQEQKLNIRVGILTLAIVGSIFGLTYLYSKSLEKTDVKETPVLLTPVEAEQPIEVVEVLPEPMQTYAEPVKPAPKPIVKPVEPQFKTYKLMAKTKLAPNGKRMCATKKDEPVKSEENGKWHPDRECCLDPYEMPNGACYYPPKYDKLIQKYLNK